MMILPQDPIFIVGYPRSGTTLLQRLLAAQPSIYTFPETHYFNVIEKKIKWEKAADNESIPLDSLPVIFAKIAEKMEFLFTTSEQESLKRQAANKTLSSKALFEYIVTRYLLKLYPEIKNVSSFRWMEKTPNHAHFLERIISIYPDAQFLHILRHPVPAIYSRKKKFPFNRETPIVELARRWKRMLLDVEHFKENCPSHIFTLRYEDLVCDLEKQLQSVADFLEIRLDFEALTTLKQKRVQDADAFILQSETWKQEDLLRDIRTTNEHYHDLISSADTASIEEITMESMKRYGYESFSGSLK
jgi:hypothetical protein